METLLANFTIPISEIQFWDENPDYVRQRIQEQIFETRGDFGNIYDFQYQETFRKEFDNGTALIEFSVVIG